ncbi:MAG: SpoIIE family protein phosphatase [Anaerolineales bacterium]|nr:SpoIIE family protein phosphatase [Anaerolineales bacterium]
MNFVRKLFDRLFSRKPRPPKGAIVQVPPDSGMLESVWSLDGTQSIQVGMGQSTGIVRTHNEDSLFAMTGNAFGEEPLRGFGLFLVADGMGGHRAGEIASSISLKTVAKHVTEHTLMQLFDAESPDENTSLQEILKQALIDANEAVVTKVPGGGTTLTAAVVMDGELAIGHVGDSRAYVIIGNDMKAITRDHSLVERLRELGQLTPEEAAAHPQRNVLYRAIGQGANLEIDTTTHPVPNGGYLLLCSDGLWGEVSEDIIRGIIYSANHPQDACEALVRAANAAGGPDNISAVLVRFPSN